MRTEPQRDFFSKNARAICLLSLFVFCAASISHASTLSDRVSCRPELTSNRRAELESRLRQITGWNSLAFDESGILRLGDKSPVGGSQSARELLTEAVSGRSVILLEDASDSQDIAFCRVIPGRWKTKTSDDPPVFIIQIDFTDFSHVMGDRAALDAFNTGWGVLHEISHVVNDTEDPETDGEAGECEELINRMRRECGLAERSEYYFKLLPGTTSSSFTPRFVRLAFDQQETGKKKRKRYWLIWDASLVGGVDEQKLMAVRR